MSLWRCFVLLILEEIQSPTKKNFCSLVFLCENLSFEISTPLFIFLFLFSNFCCYFLCPLLLLQLFVIFNAVFESLYWCIHAVFNVGNSFSFFSRLILSVYSSVGCNAMWIVILFSGPLVWVPPLSILRIVQNI